MPTALDRDGFKYYFFSNEHLPEHVHVKNASGRAKFDNSLTETMPTVHYADGRIFVMLPHGINLSFPVEGNWRLETATPDLLNDMVLDDEGIHWPALDEDLSYEGLLRGDYGQFVRPKMGV